VLLHIAPFFTSFLLHQEYEAGDLARLGGVGVG
jgi:hypothetical protein